MTDGPEIAGSDGSASSSQAADTMPVDSSGSGSSATRDQPSAIQRASDEAVSQDGGGVAATRSSIARAEPMRSSDQGGGQKHALRSSRMSIGLSPSSVDPS